ncbi:hypothetical protein D3C76_601420 [compost metagenome]
MRCARHSVVLAESTDKSRKQNSRCCLQRHKLESSGLRVQRGYVESWRLPCRCCRATLPQNRTGKRRFARQDSSRAGFSVSARPACGYRGCRPNPDTTLHRRGRCAHPEVPIARGFLACRTACLARCPATLSEWQSPATLAQRCPADLALGPGYFEPRHSWRFGHFQADGIVCRIRMFACFSPVSPVRASAVEHSRRWWFPMRLTPDPSAILYQPDQDGITAF